jgi:hypothetical protein
MNKYYKWIKHNVNDTGYGKCKDIAQAMCNDFQELTLRYGIFHSLAWGERQHYWCRHNTTHEIIDPTGSQFPDGYVRASANCAAYEDLTDLTEEQCRARLPSGKCPNCGDLIYGGNSVCSDRCGTQYTAYLNSGVY